MQAGRNLETAESHTEGNLLNIPTGMINLFDMEQAISLGSCFACQQQNGIEGSGLGILAGALGLDDPGNSLLDKGLINHSKGGFNMDGDDTNLDPFNVALVSWDLDRCLAEQKVPRFCNNYNFRIVNHG